MYCFVALKHQNKPYLYPKKSGLKRYDPDTAFFLSQMDNRENNVLERLISTATLKERSSMLHMRDRK